MSDAHESGKLAGNTVLLQEERGLELPAGSEAEHFDEAGPATLVQPQPLAPSQLPVQLIDERLGAQVVHTVAGVPGSNG